MTNPDIRRDADRDPVKGECGSLPAESEIERDSLSLKHK